MAKMSIKAPKFTFIREAFGEMKNVTWPTPRKVSVFTGLVIIVVLIFSYFTSFVDRGFLAGLGALRSNLNPDSVKVDTAPTIQATPGQILDSNGNEIEINSVLDKEQLEKALESTVKTAPAEPKTN